MLYEVITRYHWRRRPVTAGARRSNNPKGRLRPQVIGVPRETAAGEKRVATVPEVVEKLRKLGFEVVVESGAGDASNFSDDAYRAAGARIVASADALWAEAVV